MHVKPSMVKLMASIDIEFSSDSVIRGHHIYKRVWTPSVGETVQLELEEENEHDNFANPSRTFKLSRIL